MVGPNVGVWMVFAVIASAVAGAAVYEARLTQAPDASAVGPAAFVTTTVVPAADVEEEAGRYVVEVDIPGAVEADVHVELEGQRLTITGSRRRASQAGHFLRHERKLGSFARRIDVPGPVVEAEMSMQLLAGVLVIVLPKQNES